MNWRKVRIATTATLLIGVVTVGAYNAISPPQVVPAAAEQKNPSSFHVDSTQGASTYALYFSHYWLTGNQEEAQKYAAQGFEVNDQPKPEKVESIVAWGSRSLDKNRVVVTIRARLPKDQVVWLAVPVVVRDGQYGVYQIPTYVPKPETAKQPAAPNVNMIQDHKAEKAIRQTIRSFFRNYSGGTPEDLANLFSDGKNRKVLGLEGKFTESLSTDISEPEQDQVYVQVEAVLQVGDRTVPQHYEFWLRKNGPKWLIEKTNPAIPLEQHKEEE